MLTKKQIEEIREHLDRAQNPVFFFDNDVDGLVSFLLLQRYIERGKGVAVKSYPGLAKDYFRKVDELNADYIFILDKPIVDKEFFDEAEKFNIPVVWIDHHDIEEGVEIPKFVNYYNPLPNKKSKKDFYKNQMAGEPTSYLAYSVSRKKEDIWLAVCGCIGDRYFPNFYEEFMEKYSELGFESENPFDIFYKSKIGEMANLFNFALKDRISNVVNMSKFLMKVKSPSEVFEENKKNKSMHQRFEQINAKYQKLLTRANIVAENSGKILFFKFGGDLSIASDLSNELNYLYPDKITVVAFDNGYKMNISMRGENVRDLISKAMKNLENSTGGGHRNAVGGTVRAEDFEKFKDKLEKLVITK